MTNVTPVQEVPVDAESRPMIELVGESAAGGCCGGGACG
jgi:hypothetical protein